MAEAAGTAPDEPDRPAEPALPAYPAAVLAGIRAAESDGRLPAPSAELLGSIFPFEAGQLQVVPVEPPTLPEPARSGEGGRSCGSCSRPDADFAWTSPRWRLESLTVPQRLGVHVFMLTVRDHADLAELSDELMVEQGRLLVAVERAITTGIDGVARVHVIRWGDGGSHLHWWFMARPAGLLQLRGSHLPTWLDVLPPLPEQLVAADVSAVVAELARSGW